MLRRTAYLLSGGTALAVLLLGETALAQAAPPQADTAAADNQSGEIIVTATRKSESINKVPISVSASTFANR